MNSVLEFRAETDTQRSQLKELEKKKTEIFAEHTAALEKLQKDREHISYDDFMAMKRKVTARILLQ